MFPAPLPPLSLALLPEAAVVLAPDGLVLASSPLAAELFRTVPVGCTLADLVPDPTRLWAAVEGLATGSHVPAVPLEGVRANGVPFGMDASVRVLEGGGLLCVFRELDPQLTTSLDAAFDHMPIGVALSNSDGEFVRVNPAMCALLGRDADELLLTRELELTHPEDRQHDLDAARRILRGETNNRQTEKRYLRPDGEVVSVLASVTFVRDKHGRPLCWVGHFQDITELRRLASRDPLTDALNRRAFELELARCPDGAVLLLDLDGFERGVTASIGLSPVGVGVAPAAMLAAADRAMYDAKAVGGGRVRTARG